MIRSFGITKSTTECTLGAGESERGQPFPRTLTLVLSDTGEVIEGFSHISHFDGSAHFHMEDDSSLKVGYYEVRGFKDPEVIVHVLDALAAL